MRVLFTGTAGVGKRNALANLTRSINDMFGGNEHLYLDAVRGAPPSIPILENQLYGADAHPFLRLHVDQQKERWSDSFGKIRRGFDGARASHQFLGLHLTYHFQQVPTCSASLSQLQEWRPDCIISLVDDVYCVRERIHRGGHRKFTLFELLLWRSEEVLVGDLLAGLINPSDPPPNFIFAVKHSANTLAKLLLGKEIIRLYTSYEISNVWQHPTKRNVIDTFRRRIRTLPRCVAFDPLTIDEFRPVLEATQGSGNELSYDARKPEHRWPILDPADCLMTDDDLQYPLQLPRLELCAMRDAIDGQVKLPRFGGHHDWWIVS